MARKVLVCIDRSEGGVYAAQWAFENILRSGDDVTLFSVVPVYTHAAPVFGSSITFDEKSVKVQHDVYEETEKLLAYLTEHLNKCNAQVKYDVKTGDARDVILEYADTNQMDLLVLGATNRGVLSRTFLGSVSDYCVQNSKCPVVLVRKESYTGPV
eukprot:comp5900_c0_seq1/m.1758 comp5900_c0_seq1/g.1758  ORF comp5900_c0_seq1/g.1758 comp5900_c0_seq1/m.1758 type:complete len:156 (-) comp5900_c0_seq1:388-855(-)